MKKDEKLDHTPLTFGKHKGKTPLQVFELLEDYSWLKWAYENVKNAPVCSEVLYRECKKELNASREWDDEEEQLATAAYGYLAQG